MKNENKEQTKTQRQEVDFVELGDMKFSNLNKENEKQVQNFLFHVLHLQCWPEKLNPDRGKEKKITQTLFASFLLWLDSVSSTI